MNILRPLLLPLLASAIATYAATPTRLRVEYCDSGAVIQTAHSPRLSWNILPEPGRTALGQSAYRIQVASSPQLLENGTPDLWETNKTISPSMVNIPYAGSPLSSHQNCWWRVKVWDENDTEGPWSQPSQWAMAILDPAQWLDAKWIALRPEDEWRTRHDETKKAEAAKATPTFPLINYKDRNIFHVYDSIRNDYDAAPLLRKQFAIAAQPSRAMLYICGLGYFEAAINGRSVSDDKLNPAWTVFDKSPLYCAYDVTSLLSPGQNTIGVTLGRGQYSPICNDAWGQFRSSWIAQPKLIALLRIENPDGTVANIITDSSWQATQGPMVMDDTRIGEIFDARLDMPGWDTPDFDASSWQQAHEVPGNTELVTLQMLPPIRAYQPLLPTARIDRPGGIEFDPDGSTSIFNIGRNVAGWARVKVRGPRGARVLVEYCESPSDSALLPNLHPARFKITEAVADKFFASFHDATSENRQQNAYILSGNPDGEEFECHFSYKGFQFARVTADSGVEVLSLEGIPVHSSLTPAGHFACSDSTVNRIQQLARTSLLSNLMGIPTDCPHREKQGWLADGYFTVEAAMYNFDMAQFYAKWLGDMLDTQGPGGEQSTVAPSSNFSLDESISWPAAMVYVPRNMLDFYADSRTVERMTPAMQRFAQSIRNHEKGQPRGYVTEILGDWVSPAADSILPSLRGSSLMAPPEGVIMYGTAAYASILNTLASLSSPADSAYYRSWAQRVTDDLNHAFLHAADSTYVGHIPTPYRMAPNAVALHEQLVPDSMRNAVGQRLLAYLDSTGYKMNVGFLGTRALMKWLPTANPEAAFRAATQPEFPGWGYMVANGATSMWEDWAGCASLNHLPYCLISEYFFRHLAGLNLSHSTPSDGGSSELTPNLLIAPTIIPQLDWAEGSLETIYGTLACRWERNPDSSVTLTLTVPPATSATLHLPSVPDRTIPSGTHTITLPAAI